MCVLNSETPYFELNKSIFLCVKNKHTQRIILKITLHTPIIFGYE